MSPVGCLTEPAAEDATEHGEFDLESKLDGGGSLSQRGEGRGDGHGSMHHVGRGGERDNDGAPSNRQRFEKGRIMYLCLEADRENAW